MTVLDPLIFRTAELFLGGGKLWLQTADEKEQKAKWQAIDKNIGALLTFFDSVILNDRLPIFDYQSTFQRQALLQICEQHNLLVPVHVTGKVYEKSKESALAELARQGPIEPDLAKDIIGELSAFDYDWQPELGDLQPPIPTTKGRRTPSSVRSRALTAFRLGGVLFDGYAQQLSVPHGTADEQAEHVFQPKRSRLYLAASLRTARAREEDQVFGALKRIANAAPLGLLRVVEMPAAPTFLPLLVQDGKPQTAAELLELALAWRDKPAVKRYRAWRRAIAEALHEGTVPPGLEDELKRIAAAFGTKEDDRNTKISLSAAVTPLSVEPKVEFEFQGAHLPGWFQRLLPGGRHRHLLIRLVRAARQGYAIDRKLGNLWHAS
jgi:hypothetical protein